MIDWALYYAAHGWPVLPLHTWTGTTCTCNLPDCSSPAKHPRTRQGLKDATDNEPIIRSWWERWPAANIGLRTGIAFDVLDIDGDEGFAAVTEIETEHGPARPGPTSYTGGGGLHRLYLPTGVGNRAGMLDHVDWRGKGGYIVAPPSLHATGVTYTWADDPALTADANLPAVTGWLKDLLFPPTPPPRTAGTLTTAQRGDSGRYARKALDAEIGELLRTAQGGRNDQLNQAAFNMYQLAAGGEIPEQEVTDILTAAAQGIGLGQREIDQTLKSARHGAAQHPRTAPALSIIHGTTAIKPDLEPIAHNPADEPEDQTTGWEPADIAALLDSDLTIPPPTLCPRTDQICLLYAGKLHAFNGEPESGKSWAAQHAAHQNLQTGNHTAYIDFEDSPESVLGRLLNMGATPQQLAHLFTYIQPDRPLTPEAGAVLRNHFQTHRPTLAIIDGVTEAMSTLGLEPLDNADTAKFFRALPRPLARLGAAVILVDHVVKDREQRGRWAIGSQHKMAALTGAAYTIEVATPFGRNKHGIAKLIVTKDRPGWVRQHAAGATIAELHLISNGDNNITVELRPPPQGTDGQWRPTAVMERISQTLAHGPALTGRAIRGAVRGKDEHIALALQLLIAEGYVQAHRQGQAIYHTHLKDYPDPEDTEDGEVF